VSTFRDGQAATWWATDARELGELPFLSSILDSSTFLDEMASVVKGPFVVILPRELALRAGCVSLDSKRQPSADCHNLYLSKSSSA
jgi:hypothetical protein